MVTITASVRVDAPVQDVWDRLTDWPRHGRFVPLTSVRVLTAQARGVGARFVGRTALGPVGFDDPMQVTAWSPPAGGGPARCEVVKQGRVLLGSASFEVRPDGPGSAVTWTEDVELGPVARVPVLARVVRLSDPLVAATVRVLLRRVLRAMFSDLTGSTGATGSTGTPGGHGGH